MKSTNPYIEVQYEDLVLVMRKTGLVPAVSSGQHQAASLLRVDPSHSATSLILSPVADRVDVLRRVGCHYLDRCLILKRIKMFFYANHKYENGPPSNKVVSDQKRTSFDEIYKNKNFK